VEEEEGGEDTEDRTVKERKEAAMRVIVKIEDVHRSLVSPANLVKDVNPANLATSPGENADARTDAPIREATAETHARTEEAPLETKETWTTVILGLKGGTTTLLDLTTTAATTPTVTVPVVAAVPGDEASRVAADRPAVTAAVDVVLPTTETATIMSTTTTAPDSNSKDLVETTTTERTGVTRTAIVKIDPRTETEKSSVPAATVPDTETGVVRVTAVRVTAKPPRRSSTIIS